MKIDLLQVPYHLGKENVGMGNGPVRYIQKGADRALSKKGFDVRTEAIKCQSRFEDEVGAITEINSNLARRVKRAVADGSFPMILSGNCISCLGVLAGLNSTKTGIIWFDAHGDSNTPENTTTNCLDGMGLAIAIGWCHRDLWKKISCIDTIPETQTILVGTRDLDTVERENLEKSKVGMVVADGIKKFGLANLLLPRLKDLKLEVEDVYLHIDIDVLDPLEAPGVDFRVPNGLSSKEMVQAIKMVAKHFKIRAATLSAYNPDYEEDDKSLKVGLHLMSVIADEVFKSR